MRKPFLWLTPPLLLWIAGCSPTPCQPLVEYRQPPVIHPALPEPPTPRLYALDVRQIDGQEFVTLTWPDYEALTENIIQTVAYAKSLRAVLQFYREEKEVANGQSPE